MKISTERGEVLAIQALGYLAGDSELLERFFAVTGMDADGLRASAGDTGTLIAVMDFLLFDDALVLDFAEIAGIKPEEVGWIRLALAGPEIDQV